MSNDKDQAGEKLECATFGAKDGRYPYSIPPASREFDYSAAAAFLENFIRWFWTEKYTDEHVARMAGTTRFPAGRQERQVCGVDQPSSPTLKRSSNSDSRGVSQNA